jgi:methyltransferase (TIGR00027 family)
MNKGHPSETARISAMMRAAHRLLDSPPLIFDDTWAAQLAGFRSDVELRDAIHSFQGQLASFGTLAIAATWIRASRLGVALRGRYAEDELVKAMGRGVRQFVIAGAGLDSFAYRRRDLAPALQIFEVDHPDTQHQKRRRLEELQVTIPSHVTFVPIDFQAQTGLFTALDGTSFDPKQPTFFSFLGVSWYLNDEALDRALREFASAASGSELVIDYLLPEHLLDEECRNVARMLSAMAASHGEPGGNCFEPAQITRRLESLGFSHAEVLGAREANARYCAQRDDDLRIPDLLHLAKARVERLAQFRNS